MKTTAITLAAVLAAGSAQALGVGSFAFSGDDGFTSRCNQGTSNVDCEFAVGEARRGNKANDGNWEIGLLQKGGGPTSDEKDLAWQTDQSYDFVFSYAGAAEQLTLTVGTKTTTAGGFDFDNAQSIFIRTRSNPDTDSAVRLTDLKVNGHAVPGASVFDPGSDVEVGVQYLQVFGFELSQDWSLTGNIAFSLLGGEAGSNPAAQFKVTDIAPIPLPAGAWLLLSGVGGLGFFRWRKQRAA